MNVFNEVVRGAAQQFGREFGRAGANAVLKGKNYYAVKNISDYSGRIKPSDSEVVRGIKEINKIKFVTTNKANTSRLIDSTDIVLDIVSFKGVETLNQINDIKVLLDTYNDKFEHGSALIDDGFKDKSVDYLEDKRKDFIDKINTFNDQAKTHIQTNLDLALENKKTKKTAVILSFPIPGCFGVHKFYLGENGYGMLYLLFSWTIIPAIASLFNFFRLLTMSEEKFDTKYNPVLTYYRQFSYTTHSKLDEYFNDVAHFCLNNKQISRSDIQRKFKLGYNRAGKILSQLEDHNILKSNLSSNSYGVLIKDITELEEILNSLNDDS